MEASDPQFEHEHLSHVTLFSRALGRRGDITFFLPPQALKSKSVPLLVLLHGVYGSHWSWAMQGGVHRTCLQLISQGCIRPMILAMPSDGLWGKGSGYLTHSGEDHECWIMQDVVAAAYEFTRVVDIDSPIFLAGLSMGGYGALRLGAKYSDRIAGVSVHSAITRVEQLRTFTEESVWEEIGKSDDETDPMFWIRKHAAVLPPLRLDCGILDNLLEPNRELHRQLMIDGIFHTYEEFAGGHDWDYWRVHVRETLLFVESVLR